MVKTLLSENTTGDITSKRWHLMALMLRMIPKLKFTCIYNLLAPRIDLLLITFAISIVVVIAAVIIVPYDK